MQHQTDYWHLIKQCSYVPGEFYHAQYAWPFFGHSSETGQILWVRKNRVFIVVHRARVVEENGIILVIKLRLHSKLHSKLHSELLSGLLSDFHRDLH